MAAGCTEQSEDVCVEVGAQQLACQYAVIWQGGGALGHSMPGL